MENGAGGGIGDKTSWEEFRRLLIYQVEKLDDQVRDLHEDLIAMKIEIATLNTKIGVIFATSGVAGSVIGGIMVAAVTYFIKK